MLQRLLIKTDLDQAVIFTLLTRGWQVAAGVVSLLLIATFFPAEVQGYYYTFLSLLALQVFFELALYNVIVSRASHEWSKLRIDASGYVAGDASALSRLASLGGFIAKWYTGVSLLFALGVGVAGYIFLSQSHSIGIAWQAPWWTVVGLAAVQLWLIPVLSLLEGCNQVVALNRFRFAQTVAEALTMWLLILSEAGLWVVAGSLAVKIVTSLLFLLRRYRRFFLSLTASPKLQGISWREEIWPMQWRLGVQGAVNYLVYSLFVPVMFQYHGPKIAGQMGMTLQVISVAQIMGFAWVQTKIPHFGILVAKRKYAELNRRWWRALKLSFGFTLAGSLIIWLGVLVLGEVDAGLSSRLLGPLPTALFLLAYALSQVSGYQAVYLRAHAREPFVVVGLLTGLLCGILVFLFGSNYGPTGAAASFLAVIGLFTLPFTTTIWIRRRAEWQTGEPPRA